MLFDRVFAQYPKKLFSTTRFENEMFSNLLYLRLLSKVLNSKAKSLQNTVERNIIGQLNPFSKYLGKKQQQQYE